MSNEILALAITILVHVVGMGVLIWALLGDEATRGGWRRWFRVSDDHPTPPAPNGGAALDDADPSAVRLREPGRLADGYPATPRRPRHAPQPAPTRPAMPRR